LNSRPKVSVLPAGMQWTMLRDCRFFYDKSSLLFNEEGEFMGRPSYSSIAGICSYTLIRNGKLLVFV